jgi:hypothetical protein
LPFYWLHFNLKQHGSVPRPVPDMERMGTFAEKFVAKLESFYVTDTKNYMLNMLYNTTCIKNSDAIWLVLEPLRFSRDSAFTMGIQRKVGTKHGGVKETYYHSRYRYMSNYHLRCSASKSNFWASVSGSVVESGANAASISYNHLESRTFLLRAHENDQSGRRPRATRHVHAIQGCDIRIHQLGFQISPQNQS